jgi:hypothetical protein
MATYQPTTMEIDLTRLNLADLNLMLNKAEKELQEKLLEGVSWNVLKPLQYAITDLRIAIHRLAYPHDNSDIREIRKKLDRNPSLHSIDLSAE